MHFKISPSGKNRMGCPLMNGRWTGASAPVQTAAA